MTSTPRVAFRTEAGPGIGLGHIRRCSALAEALRALGVESLFLVAGDPRARESLVAAGCEAVPVEPARDLAGTLERCRERSVRVIVVDSYAVATSYLTALDTAGLRVAVIDDVGDRDLPVDLVINVSAGAERLRYRGAPHTRYLLGPRHALLRTSFGQGGTRSGTDRANRILITVGGADPLDLTSRLIGWTTRALGAVEQEVVLGPFSARSAALQAAVDAAGGRVLLHEDPKDVAPLMLAADMAVCGGGQTTSELAATGTPAIAIRLAENQTLNLTALSEAGTLVWAGDARDTDLGAKVTTALAGLGADSARRDQMSRTGRTLVDGRGAARVARAVAELEAAE